MPTPGSPERLRVLRIIARMNVGGPALQVVGLTEDLDPDRFDQRLLVGSVGREEEDFIQLRAPGTPAFEIPGLGRSPRPLDDVRALARLVRELRSFRPHIVHTHTAKAGVLGRLAAAVGRTPARVHHFHGHLLHGYFSPRVTKAVVLTERALARGTDRLVAVGGRVRDELVAARIGRPEQYVVVPPGVQLPPPPSRGEARRRLGVEADAPVAVFVARLTQVKRPDRFIEMAKLVHERMPSTQFLVVGEGALLDESERLARALGGRVRFLGWRGDVEVIYAAADVVVLTSDNEGMPVSLIEAATIGCPAVTTRVGSAAEVVLDGTTGFVTGLDAVELAAAVERVLSDPSLRARLSSAALDHARAHFSRARLVRDVARLYEELAQEKGFA